MTRTLPARISMSQVLHFDQCPMMWRFEKLTDIEPQLTEGTVERWAFGRVVHTALEALYAYLQRTQRDALANEHWRRRFAIEEARTAFDDAVQAEQLPIGDIDEAWEHVLAELDDDWYDALVPAHYEILEVERTHYASVRGYGVTVKIDLVLLDHEQERLIIVDHKTGNVRDPFKLRDDFQLGLYAAAADNLWPQLTMGRVDVAFNNTSQARNSGQRLIAATVTPQQKRLAVERVIRTRDRIVQAFRDDDFPAHPGDHCSWCDYAHVCPAALPTNHPVERAGE